MIERILGIDVGTTNLGISLVEVDEANQPSNKILHAEVLKFEAAEVEAIKNKKWESLNKERRLAKGGRKTWNRKKLRLQKIKQLCIDYIGLQWSDFYGDTSIFHRKGRDEPFEIRNRAVTDNKTLTAHELAQVLIHIAKSRHFAFGSKSEENLQKADNKKRKNETIGQGEKKEKETLEVLHAIATMGEKYEQFLENGGKTIGQMIFQEPFKNQSGNIIYRNRANKVEKIDKKSGKKTYELQPIYHYNLKRDWLIDEIKTIFNHQNALGSTLCSKELLEKYLAALIWTKPQEAVGDKVGYCSYLGNTNDHTTKRAPKYSYNGEIFRALSKINTTKVLNTNTGEVLYLKDIVSTEQLLSKFREQKTITYKTIRGLLQENLAIKFFESKSRAELTDEGKEFFSLEGYHTLKNAISKATNESLFQNIFNDTHTFNQLAVVLSWEKDDEKKSKKINALLKFTIIDDTPRQNIIDELLKISAFKGTVGFCFRVLEAIIPIMQAGYDTTTAIEKAVAEGHLPPKKDLLKYDKLPPLEWVDTDGFHQLLDIVIANPAVKRSLSKLRTLLNELIRRYGKFDRVHIELAREINDSKTRAEIIKTQNDNEKLNDAAKQLCEECGVEPTGGYGGNLNKAKFYKMQNAKSAYSDKPILLKDLFTNEYEIDHIIPQSRGGGDNTSNLVLCRNDENRNKNNQTPYEWFGHNEEKWEWFKKWINALKLPDAKRKMLLKTNFDENSEKEFTNRALNDTRYMARAIHEYLNNYLPLNPPKHKGQIQIKVRNGRLTGTLRRFWLWEKDRDKDVHHAEDAIILAFSTDSNVKKLSDYIRSKERREKKLKFEEPMPYFRDHVKKALELTQTNEQGYKRLLIVNLPSAKVTGLAHQETFYSPKYKTVKKAGGGFTKKGKPKEGGGYAKMKDTDVKLGVETSRGITVKEKPARRDVYCIDGIYEVVSISVPDMNDSKKSLPTVANSGNDMKEHEQDFMFSLFKNNLIEIKKKKWETPILCYFQYMNTDGRIMVNLLDGTFKETIADISKLDTIEYIKKYTIDPLGYYHEVKSEKRLGTIPQEAKKHPKRHK